jgi:hypothetical protein
MQLVSRVKVQRNQDESRKLSKIIKNQKELKEELVRLRYEESKLKDRRASKLDRNQRSRLTTAEIRDIHRSLNARKEFEEACEQKKAHL